MSGRAGPGGDIGALASLFLKLGTIAFGGPAAHIAMMEDEVVRRRQWLTRDEFLDLLGATNLIPGPNSTEMAIHIGARRGGALGLVIAGTCFILPAMLIVLGCAWAYQHFGKLPATAGVLYGIKPVIIAVVLQALWRLAQSAARSLALAGIGMVVAIAVFLGANELLLLLLAGFASVFLLISKRSGNRTPGVAGWWPVLLGQASLAAGSGVGAAAVPFTSWGLFLFFLKIGSVLYGSGYVLLAFLRNGLVVKYGWLTESQLLDAIAIGQFTPGPVFTTATFIGYLLGGTPAALLATLGIFLPAFIFVAVSGPLVPRIRQSPAAGAFLDGVNVASLALMAVVTAQLGRAALVDWLTLLLAAAAAVLLFARRINSAWLVLGGALVGTLKTLMS